MEFQLIAGHVALDLANTLDNRGQGERELELLDSYAAFLDFAEQSGVVTRAERQRLKKVEPGRVVERCREVREALQEIFAAVAMGTAPPDRGVEVLNRALHRAWSHRVLAGSGAGVVWTWERREDPESPLWPMVTAAVELLVSEDVQRVRLCESADCRWLFLDQSKNHSRRWCDMKVCGNRVKARRYWERRGKAGG